MKQSSSSYVSVGIEALDSVYENIYLTSGIVYVLFYQVHDIQIPLNCDYCYHQNENLFVLNLYF
jgi:hypothetical protein